MELAFKPCIRGGCIRWVAAPMVSQYWLTAARHMKWRTVLGRASFEVKAHSLGFVAWVREMETYCSFKMHLEHKPKILRWAQAGREVLGAQPASQIRLTLHTCPKNFPRVSGRDDKMLVWRGRWEDVITFCLPSPWSALRWVGGRADCASSSSPGIMSPHLLPAWRMLRLSKAGRYPELKLYWCVLLWINEYFITGEREYESIIQE